jgi:Acetyltransferase (GNAT) domain
MPTSQENINKNENSGYSIVRLNKNNLVDVAKLHTAVYGTAAAVDYFVKKYDTSYTGVEDVGFIAYNNDNLPVAYYGVIPCFIQHGKNIILAAQSADTMTHPRHRYKGMFVELANLTYALGEKLGIRLIVGFPNQNSYHAGVKKLGFTMLHTMSYFTIDINGLAFESLSKKNWLFKKLYQRFRQSVLKKYITPSNGVISSAVQDGFAVLYRSSAYLNYKTYGPTTTIRIDDVTIWISNKDGLLIGDMAGINDINFPVVINQLKRIAKRLGVRQIRFHCSPDTSLHRLFSEICQANPSFPVLFRDFESAIPLEKIKFTFADIDIF